MTHPAIDQLRFTRAEFRRGLAGLDRDEASRRIGPAKAMGHLDLPQFVGNIDDESPFTRF